MLYINAKAYDMLAVYYQCFQNASITEGEYTIRYPDRRHYTRKVFRRMVTRLRKTGSVLSIPVPKRNEDNIINVLAYVETEPNLSIREIFTKQGVSVASAVRILRYFKLHPDHQVSHQALSDTDFDRLLAERHG